MVNCVKELLDKLISEIAMDTSEEVGYTIDPTKATLLVRVEVARWLQPYPRHSYLLMLII